MERHEELKNVFTKMLNEQMEGYRINAERLMRESRRDEANLEKIKFNVADIFYKMFNVSYNNVYVKLNNPNLKKLTDPVEGKYNKLFAAYMHFFDTIPAPWAEKHKLASERGMDIECIVEELKIDTVNKLKEAFIKLYDKYSKAEVKM